MVIHNAGPPQTMSKDVLYIGSAVPLETSSGLDAIQQPLRARYPLDDKDIQGIPSIVSVLPGGLQLKYMDDPSHVVFFPYSALQLCAAVRCVTSTNISTNEVERKFVSLTDAPESNRPAIFTTVTRRTQGRHVLECSGFLTKYPTDALELVQWTSEADKRSKLNRGEFVSMNSATASSAGFTNAHDLSSRHDTSFRTELSSPPIVEIPPSVNGASSMGTPNLMPSNYDELPKQGYFYTTENAQVKKFSLQKFVRQQGPPPPPPAVTTIPAQPLTPQIEGIPIKINHVSAEDHHNKSSAHIINGDSFDRRSTHSVPIMTRSPRLIAVRGPPPPGATIITPAGPRPIMVGRSGYPPHPMMMRGAYPPMAPRPMMYPAPMMVDGKGKLVPMMMPVPMGYPQYSATLPKQNRNARRSSSSGSSSSSSSRGRSAQRKLNVSRRDHSFDLPSSRPETPPTDYDSQKRGHTSRKDEHNQSMQLNGFHGGAMTLMHPGRQGMPPGFVMMPVQADGAIYGTTLPRSKSMPAFEKKSNKKKNKKKDKSKKDKKNKKDKHNKNNYLDPYEFNFGDYTTDGDFNGYGYNSDNAFQMYTGSTPYRDSQKSKSNGKLGDSYNNQRSFSRNAAERAFSSSLAAETKKSSRGHSMNAYAMNHNGHGEGEFPTMR